MIRAYEVRDRSSVYQTSLSRSNNPHSPLLFRPVGTLCSGEIVVKHSYPTTTFNRRTRLDVKMGVHTHHNCQRTDCIGDAEVVEGFDIGPNDVNRTLSLKTPGENAIVAPEMKEFHIPFQFCLFSSLDQPCNESEYPGVVKHCFSESKIGRRLYSRNSTHQKTVFLCWHGERNAKQSDRFQSRNAKASRDSVTLSH